ncbi:MAG: zeta toxin family protein [Bacteroidota bacterium]
MKRLYVISGCNGAGKTTASYTILPEMLNCSEFVNADEIAKGLSPFNPNNVAIKAGRLMLNRIKELIEKGEDFAFETTLSTRSYTNTIKRAQEAGYLVTVLYFWLNSKELAIERVKVRVEEGGHDIPKDVIKRRYDLGIKNMFNLYIPIADYWMFIDNSNTAFELIADGEMNKMNVNNENRWDELKSKYYGNKGTN